MAGVLGICQISKLNMILTGNENTGANISLIVKGEKILSDLISRKLSKGPVSGLTCPYMVFLSSEVIVLLSLLGCILLLILLSSCRL